MNGCYFFWALIRQNALVTLPLFCLFGLFFNLIEPSSAQTASLTETAKKVVLCSTTQIADFAKQVVGDRWEVVCVLAAGQDPHTYEVGSDDLLAVQRANLCLQNGWHLEGNHWMRTMAEKAGKPIVDCIEGVPPLIIEGITGVERGKTKIAYDPHAWFDPKRAQIYVKNIRDAVIEIDPENAAYYEERTRNYLLALRELDCWILEQVNAIPRNRRVLITHHDAFGYFCEAYGFESITPVGWTTGEFTDVTIDQRQQIVSQIRRLGVKSIFVESSVNPQLLSGIARDAGVIIGGELYSDAMGAAGTEGETYIGMMRKNVKTIVQNMK